MIRFAIHYELLMKHYEALSKIIRNYLELVRIPRVPQEARGKASRGAEASQEHCKRAELRS